MSSAELSGWKSMKMNNPAISNRNSLLILVIYFIGYIVLFPMIASFTSEIIYIASGRDVTMVISSILYLLTFVLVVYLSRDTLRRYLAFFRENSLFSIINGFIRFLQMFGIFVFINLGLFILVGRESVNEQAITQELLNYPVYIGLLSCVFAPVVEEIVFREIIFKKLTLRYNFWVGLLISSFLFGFIHVMDAVLMGHFEELIFIISYGGLGLMLALGYRYRDNGTINILMHFFNNFLSIVLTLMTVSS